MMTGTIIICNNGYRKIILKLKKTIFKAYNPNSDFIPFALENTSYNIETLLI